MHVLIVNNTRLPALRYGGTERVIWWLGKELARRGHRVTYLVAPGSRVPFADVLPYSRELSVAAQIPKGIDIAHIHFPLDSELDVPFLVTLHGYGRSDRAGRNTTFVSADHASRHHSTHFVHNGLDPEEYGVPDFDVHCEHLLFLAKARLKGKNLAGARRIARAAGERLVVIGGYGIAFDGTSFKGMLGGERKHRLINRSKALLFPVLWEEPFGLALIESLYFGAPVIGTPRGALPEIVTEDVGVLSEDFDEQVAAVRDLSRFDRRRCHEHVMERFTSRQMADGYLDYYERVLGGEEF